MLKSLTIKTKHTVSPLGRRLVLAQARLVQTVVKEIPSIIVTIDAQIHFVDSNTIVMVLELWIFLISIEETFRLITKSGCFPVVGAVGCLLKCKKQPTPSAYGKVSVLTSISVTQLVPDTESLANWNGFYHFKRTSRIYAPKIGIQRRGEKSATILDDSL